MKSLKFGGILAASVVMGAFPVGAEPMRQAGGGDWDVILGGGVGVSPVFEGADTYAASPVPMISVTWRDRVFLNPGDGLGAHVYRGDNLRVSTSLGYDGGRDQDDNRHLNGLGDVDGAATLNLGIEYAYGPVTPFASVTRHLGGTNGFQAEFGVQAGVPLAVLLGERKFRNPDAVAAHVRNRTMVRAEISTDWASENYMQDYFGVNAGQSARSGLGQFSADSGFKSVNATIGMMVPLGRNVMLNGNVGYSHLLGDAADSPIVQQEGQFKAGLILGYRF